MFGYQAEKIQLEFSDSAHIRSLTLLDRCNDVKSLWSKNEKCSWELISK